jgi:predicted ATPase
MAAALHQLRREVPAVQERAEAAMKLSTEQGFAVQLAIGTILGGWALAEQGQREEGIAQICQGLAAYRATGTEVHRPNFLALLAEAYGKVGRAEEGLALLAEALAAVDKTGARFSEAELYRLKGTLTLQSKTSQKQVQNKSRASLGQVQGKSKANPKLPTPNTLHPTPKRRPKPKRVSSKPSRSPVSNRRSHGSCGQR